jgi:aspartyl-tRNA(Asn)/glutamyl-tRNA(Gln) amidotransferase subunit C
MVEKKDIALSEDEVDHIAHLARLELSSEEKTQFSRDLSGILNYVTQLRELDTSEIEATFTVIPLRNVFREDRAEPSISPDEALSNAPEREGDYFRMPRILGQD